MMDTLILRFKSKKNYKLIKELASQLENQKKNLLDKGRSKRKLTPEELKAMGGILKGQLISKEHLRNISWKKRNW